MQRQRSTYINETNLSNSLTKLILSISIVTFLKFVHFLLSEVSGLVDWHTTNE